MVLYQFGNVGRQVAQALHLTPGRLFLAGSDEFIPITAAVVDEELRIDKRYSDRPWVAIMFDVRKNQLNKIHLPDPIRLNVGREQLVGRVVEQNAGGMLVITDRCFCVEPKEDPTQAERVLCMVFRAKAVWEMDEEYGRSERHAM
jgi:hypothetical protein